MISLDRPKVLQLRLQLNHKLLGYQPKNTLLTIW